MLEAQLCAEAAAPNASSLHASAAAPRLQARIDNEGHSAISGVPRQRRSRLDPLDPRPPRPPRPPSSSARIAEDRRARLRRHPIEKPASVARTRSKRTAAGAGRSASRADVGALAVAGSNPGEALGANPGEAPVANPGEAPVAPSPRLGGSAGLRRGRHGRRCGRLRRSGRTITAGDRKLPRLPRREGNARGGGGFALRAGRGKAGRRRGTNAAGAFASAGALGRTPGAGSSGAGRKLKSRRALRPGRGDALATPLCLRRHGRLARASPRRLFGVEVSKLGRAGEFHRLRASDPAPDASNAPLARLPRLRVARGRHRLQDGSGLVAAEEEGGRGGARRGRPGRGRTPAPGAREASGGEGEEGACPTPTTTGRHRAGEPEGGGACEGHRRSSPARAAAETAEAAGRRSGREMCPRRARASGGPWGRPVRRRSCRSSSRAHEGRHPNPTRDSDDVQERSPRGEDVSARLPASGASAAGLSGPTLGGQNAESASSPIPIAPAGARRLVSGRRGPREGGCAASRQTKTRERAAHACAGAGSSPSRGKRR